MHCEHKSRKNSEEYEVIQRENSYIVFNSRRIVLDVFSERYKARERSDKRTRTADIYPNEQRLIV